MFVSRSLLTIGLVAFLGSISSASNFSSPCPDLFRYDSRDQPSQWSGTLTLLSEADLHGVWIRLIFNEKLTKLDVSDNFGEVVSSENNKEYLIKNRNFLLKAGDSKPVKITVKYEGDRVPTLMEYRLNAKALCSSNGVIDAFALFPGDLDTKDFLISITSSQKATSSKELEGCGTTPLVTNHEATNVQNGQWPWQAAIYIQSNDVEKYACEATLISSRHVLTPAHCVTFQTSQLAVPRDQLTVYLGKGYQQEGKNKDLQILDVEDIFLHPGYQVKGLLNDLAIIQLDRPVAIGDYVRPICLGQSANKNVGFLVGYEIKGNKLEDLARAKATVLSEEECIQKNSDVGVLLTDNVLCAGYVDDNGPCVGDSGSSLITLRDGEKAVWELKGVVTVGVALQNKPICDRSGVTLLVDIDRYLKWIQAIIS